MRISTQMVQRFAVNGILDRQTDLSKTQQQLATGKRILTPADDPSGTTQVLALNEQISQNDQYSNNIGRLKSRLQAEESVLGSAGDILMRLRELALQSENTTYNAQARKDLAPEVKTLLGQMLDLANSKDGTGEYLFSGYQSDTQPFVDGGAGNYTFQGDQSQRSIQISATRSIQSSDSGSDIFENLDIVAGGKQNIFKTIYDFATNLDAGTTTPNITTDLDTAMSKVFTTRASIGARINAADSQEQVNQQFAVQTKSVLSSVEDLDYAKAVGDLNLQLAGLQAAQQAFTKIQNLSLFNYL
jgi:flagellar hook-associated protein 3 FlgL